MHVLLIVEDHRGNYTLGKLEIRNLHWVPHINFDHRKQWYIFDIPYTDAFRYMFVVHLYL